MSKRRVNALKGTALFIGIVQIVLGMGYLFAPQAFHASVGLENLPDWAGWPMAMSGARFLLFGFGMILVFRNPLGNRSWVQAMIGVQLIDWIATIYYVATGVVTLSQVTTAAYLPILFIVMLLATHPRVRPEYAQR
ncbi:hypothetical protein [Paenibacillus sp. MMS18-CY102]|uniref:hypothetical protein n=1 Tax=Paenibacillus sp. MMS18-CY102 TaxID=2682849 RepID=UPI00136609FC|nr:hypothetical protein [Paenibacillus sp. MMS18-CY102]MWC29168.1 hypothetical protein [Paenibacillus sp. MMS18-CY102]